METPFKHGWSRLPVQASNVPSNGIPACGIMACFSQIELNSNLASVEFHKIVKEIMRAMSYI
jgi:hypothetical protein